MNTPRVILVLLFGLFLLGACRNRKGTETEILSEPPRIYRSSPEKVFDLIHTRLFLRPDFATRSMPGEALITLSPHFYPADTLVLDARYMQIHRVALQIRIPASESNSDSLHTLGYTYDSLQLRIGLGKRYTRNDTLQIRVDYTAMPEKVRSRGSRAISSRKGLYFINPDAHIPGVPVQLWTQGETEAASCWFPTLDAPNQKSSQDLSVLIPARFKTISNGRLFSSFRVSDTMRIDRWVQGKPHAPYLFALVAGEFAEVKDQWRDKEVHYFVEPRYEQHARMVFGNTPGMLEFYSRLLGYDYPWDKYHQVVVRDFVSGAMENTGCVIHYDHLQHDHREHLDQTNEDIIAHELFHHWFGDLVTCESWANLALNESFATYGEYLWSEHRYGRDEADYQLQTFRETYFNEASYKEEDLIRYFYEDQEDMFDAHSYQKGGLILHMLRKYLGDDAFFRSLNLYLHRHAFSTAEVSDLRKAFEEVSGQDLHWFFDQWFLDKGQPTLEIIHTQTPGGSYLLKLTRKGPPFRLIADIDVWRGSGKERRRVVMDRDTLSMVLQGLTANDYVQFDAENQLLCVKEEHKTAAQWDLQFRLAPLASQRLEAFEQLMNSGKESRESAVYVREMLQDSFWYNRATAATYLQKRNFSISELSSFQEQAKRALQTEPRAAVRKAYVQLFSDLNNEQVLEEMLGDSSYDVLRRALNALGKTAPAKAYAFADAHRHSSHRKMQTIVLSSIARYSPDNEVPFLLKRIADSPAETSEIAAGALGAFLLYNRPQYADSAIQVLTARAEAGSGVAEKMQAVRAIRTLHNYFYYQSFYMQVMMGMDKNRKAELKKKQEFAGKIYARLDALLDRFPR